MRYEKFLEFIEFYFTIVGTGEDWPTYVGDLFHGCVCQHTNSAKAMKIVHSQQSVKYDFIAEFGRSGNDSNHRRSTEFVRSGD